MNCRGLAKRVMSPSSATSVAAATSAGHAALAAPSPLASATSPEARLRCGLQDDPAGPSPPRRPRCNLPARCNALRVRTTIRRASAGALGSRPAGYNDGHGAAESRRVAGAPAATRAPPPVARAPDRGSPHGLGLEPTPATVHPARCNLARLIASRRSVLSKRDVTAASHYAAIACEPAPVHFHGSSSSIFVLG